MKHFFILKSRVLQCILSTYPPKRTKAVTRQSIVWTFCCPIFLSCLSLYAGKWSCWPSHRLYSKQYYKVNPAPTPSLWEMTLGELCSNDSSICRLSPVRIRSLMHKSFGHFLWFLLWDEVMNKFRGFILQKHNTHLRTLLALLKTI